MRLQGSPRARPQPSPQERIVSPTGYQPRQTAGLFFYRGVEPGRVVNRAPVEPESPAPTKPAGANRLPYRVPTPPNGGVILLQGSRTGGSSEWSPSGAPELPPDQARRRESISPTGYQPRQMAGLFFYRGVEPGRVVNRAPVEPESPSSRQIMREKSIDQAKKQKRKAFFKKNERNLQVCCIR